MRPSRDHFTRYMQKKRMMRSIMKEEMRARGVEYTAQPTGPTIDRPVNPWEHPEETKQAKLKYVLLSYVFFNDDGEFSFREKQMLRNQTRQDRQVLSNKDLDEILSISDEELTPNHVIDYANANNINPTVVDKIVEELEHQLKFSARYVDLLQEFLTTYHINL